MAGTSLSAVVFCFGLDRVATLLGNLEKPGIQDLKKKWKNLEF